jgi:hypothetical protein
MPQNTNPIYTLTGNVSANGTTMAGTILTATGDYTGVSANHKLIHTAGANGSYVKRIKFVALGTNVATVARIYINNGSDPTVSPNNQILGQQSLPATTASNTAMTAEPEFPLEMLLPAGFRIYVGAATTVAAGWVATCIAGDY